MPSVIAVTAAAAWRRPACSARRARPGARAGRSARCSAGNVSVEFALAVPVLLFMMLGSAEMARFVLLHQKLDRVATTVSDLVSRAETITESQIVDIFTAADQVAEPFDLPDLGVVIVSSITNADGTGPLIAWQRSGGGTYSAASELGAEGDAPMLPDGFPGARGRDRDHRRGVLRLLAVPQRGDRRAPGDLSDRPPPAAPGHAGDRRSRLSFPLGARHRDRTPRPSSCRRPFSWGMPIASAALGAGPAGAPGARGAGGSGHGRAVSNARAARSTRWSACIGPTICRPTGRPAAVSPQGTEAAGCWVRLNGLLNGAQWIQRGCRSGSGRSGRRRTRRAAGSGSAADRSCSWKRRIRAPSSAAAPDRGQVVEQRGGQALGRDLAQARIDPGALLRR